MSRLAAVLLLSAALSGCASLPQGSDGLSLDAMLSFDDPGQCEPSPAFSAFLASMTEGDADVGFRPGRVVAPPQLVSRIGRVEVRKAEHYWVAHVPVAGRWLGLPVVAVHQSFPEGGDPGGFDIEIDAPVAEAEKRLRAAGFPVRANVAVPLGEQQVYDHMMTLIAAPGRPSRSLFGCGFS